MSEKRVTPLTNRGIMKRTFDVFPEETRLILESTNLMRRLTGSLKQLEKERKDRDLHSSLQLLFSRNRELIHFASLCMFNGGYASVKILTRTAVENSYCMRLFMNKPELATKWLNNPDKFEKKWKPGRIRWDLFGLEKPISPAHERFYDMLSRYVHPSSRAWQEQMSTDRSKILWRPVFDADCASECLGHIFFVIYYSLGHFLYVNRERLPREIMDEANRIMMKVDEMLLRHFRVSKGGGEKEAKTSKEKIAEKAQEGENKP